MIKNVNAAGLKEAVKGTALVDFYTESCGECKALAEVHNEIEGDLKLDVLQFNCAEDMELTAELGIMSVPTLALFKGGKEKSRLIGIREKDEIINMLK